MLSSDVSSLEKKIDVNTTNSLMKDQYVPDMKLSTEVHHSIIPNQI